jgi:hypothetical protein
MRSVVNLFKTKKSVLVIQNCGGKKPYFNESLNNSVATSGALACISAQPDESKTQATEARSTTTVAVRSVSEKNGNSPQVVPATILSENLPWSRS